MVGTDDRSGLDDLTDFGDFEGRRADVVVVAVVDADRVEARLVSLPRDLVAPDLVDGRWRTIPGANDLARNARERQFLTDMFQRIIDATNVRQLQSLAATVAPHLTLDSSLDLPRLVQTGWSMRLLTADAIETVAIPVADETLRQMAVLRPTVDVAAFLSE